MRGSFSLKAWFFGAILWGLFLVLMVGRAGIEGSHFAPMT